MRTNLQILTAFLLFVLLAGSAQAALISGPSLNATLLYYQPVPASPGSLLDVFVQISNAGDAANKVKIEFIDNSPFSVDNEQDRVKTIETIPGQDNALIKYKVRVSQDAVPGTNYIKISYAIQGSPNSQTVLLPIDIFTNTVSLNIIDVKLDPEFMVPGSIGTISFDVRNAAPLKIRDGTVTLDLSNLDIAPVASTNQQRFTDLQAGQTTSFKFDLSPSPNMAPGVYKIPILLNFSDQQGRSYSRSEYIGVRVGAKPDVSITIDSSKITADAKSGDIIVRVTNKGLGEIKFVDVTLQPSDSYTLVSSSAENYIGNIDSDDYKTASVSVEAKADEVQIPVVVTYMDALNTPYTKNEVLTLHLRPVQSGGNSTMIIVVVVIVIVIAGIIFLRRKKK